MLPNEYLNLDLNEKAFVVGAIDIKVETEKKEMKKARAKGKKR